MIRQPCTFCNARGGKKHADACARPKATIARQPKVAKHPTARPADLGFTRVSLLIDSSFSMRRFGIVKTVEMVKDQIREVKKNAAKTGQNTSLTIYTFADRVSEIAHYEDVFNAKEDILMYNPDGNTAMFDAVGLSIQDSTRRAKNPNTSFLVMIVTDGEENQSKFFNRTSIADAMRKCEGTDRWTFAFSVPRGYGNALKALGIPEGNIQEWDQTDTGLATMSTANVAGLGTYFASRAAGVTRSMNFFQPDMSQVKTRDIQNLNDLSRDFHVWNVDSSSPIREFVENKISNQPSLGRKIGFQYQIGRGYYQLTKSEEVQASKDMVILDKNTNALYGGQQARSLIGCPVGHSFKIKPGNHGNYEIFIKSTSVNRKLMPGTKVLYFVG